MEVELDSLLHVPEKLLPLITDFDNYSYFLIEGGRGGGKSNAVGRWILHLADHYKLNIFCGREIQVNIRESVYTLLVELIQEFNLNFMVMAKTIINRETKTEIHFRGFRELGSLNIQGMQGVDILWIDEAQAITKETLDRLIPTIRKDSSKVIFTMNRFVPNDPVYAHLKNRDDCLHIHLNYFDNQFCTEKLKKEALECKKMSEEDYNHIWLGQPRDKTEDAVFSFKEIETAKASEYPQRQGYGVKVAGFDIARFGDDKCACVILQQTGALHWKVVFVDQWDKKDVTYTCGRINEIVSQEGISKATIDADGLGGPYYDIMVKPEMTKDAKDRIYSPFTNPSIGYQENKDYGNNRTVNTFALKDLIAKEHIHITDEGLLDEISTLRYEFDHNGRRILISKERMKKAPYFAKSPNMADALIMAVSLVDEVTVSQTNVYGSVAGQRRHDPDNLFAIAGVR